MGETAIVVLVPKADPLVGALRRAHTRDGAEGMAAHVTLLYPFADSSEVTDDRLRELGATLAPFAEFEFTLSEARRFEGDPATLYLAVDPAPPFRALTRALVAAFPEHPPYGGTVPDPMPHVTVAQGDAAVLNRAEAEVAGRLPVAARADSVTVVEHAGGGWRERATLPLGSR